ncbi:MAG: helix-turn-helix transcriptional regulator [Pseudonocardiaceae bacterium]
MRSGNVRDDEVIAVVVGLRMIQHRLGSEDPAGRALAKLDRVLPARLRAVAATACAATEAVPGPQPALSAQTIAVLAEATTASGSVTGIEESSMRALTKLEQVLPARLRPRLAALTAATAAVPHRDAPRTDPAVLALLASCCRDQELLTFDYCDRAGQTSARRVEPHNLVTVQGRWYLLAWDPEPADWRTFRVDRIGRPSPTHRRFAARDLPTPDAASYLTQSFASASYRYTASITVALPADTVGASLFASIPGDIDSHGPDACTVRLSADSAELVTQFIAAIAHWARE